MARVLAYYLPQFHPIPENDLWWGKGFTEWTNVAKSKPLFKGHYQPRIPSELGFYDLRVSEIRNTQAKMAREAGIEGFCYWHYWFGNGKRLLEYPFNEVLKSGEPDFPFCLSWANHSWSNKTWKKKHAWEPENILIEQQYLGEEDYTNHFFTLLPAFNDKRYIKVDGKPIFIVYDPYDNSDITRFITKWRELALQNGLEGFHFVAITEASSSIKILSDGSKKLVVPSTENSGEVFNQILKLGFDAVNSFGKRRSEMLIHGRYWDFFQKLIKRTKILNFVDKYEYKHIMDNFYVKEDMWENVYPTLLPQWDRSPRTGSATGIYVNSTPEYFKKSVSEALQIIKDKDREHQILFLRSWNEWAEGNYIEPDLKFGCSYLNALKSVLKQDPTRSKL